ncbi:MAG: hypothetical protein IJH03_14180 [Clostridia bacterium]|nr:hypothetical protein [Clostridia bacterium]MBQ8963686.1 hypothetical protein [Clostridia bacterium]
MENQVFRQKSVERIASPEQLQDYMRVTTPGVWMVLAAVILLLAGLIVSSALVNVESRITEQAVVAEDGLMLDIALPLSQKSLVAPGMPVRVADREAKVSMVFQAENEVEVIAELPEDGAKLAPGTYDVEIVTETVRPISFLFSRDTEEE